MSSTILKIKKHDKNFVILDKTFIEDDRLSLKAKGLLTSLLAKPNNWNVNVNYLVKQCADGKTAVYSGLKELETYGYYKKVAIRDEKSRIIRWETIVSELPMAEELDGELDVADDKKAVRECPTKKSNKNNYDTTRDSVDTDDSNMNTATMETTDNNVVMENNTIVTCETEEFDVVFPHSENLKVGNLNLGNRDYNKYIYKINNDNNKKEYCASDDAQHFFETVWVQYPKKRGKAKISNKQKQHLCELGQEFLRALERYKAELEIEDWKQPQNGDTFFNRGYIDYLDSNYTPIEPKKPKKNSFCDFHQREYDGDELEELLLTTPKKNSFCDFPQEEYDYDELEELLLTTSM